MRKISVLLCICVLCICMVYVCGCSREQQVDRTSFQERLDPLNLMTTNTFLMDNKAVKKINRDYGDGYLAQIDYYNLKAFVLFDIKETDPEDTVDRIIYDLNVFNTQNLKDVLPQLLDDAVAFLGDVDAYYYNGEIVDSIDINETYLLSKNEIPATIRWAWSEQNYEVDIFLLLTEHKIMVIYKQPTVE